MANAPKHALCDHCRRNYHKVAIRIPRTGAVVGICPSCYNGRHTGDGGRSLRLNLIAAQVTMIYDRRARKPEWTPEMHAELAMLEEQIANFPYTDPFADRETLASYKRQMNRLILGVHV